MSRGDVGLPVAAALTKRLAGRAQVVGYDVSAAGTSRRRAGDNAPCEIADDRLASCSLAVTDEPAGLEGAVMIIVTVPTPITEERRPYLAPGLVGGHAIRVNQIYLTAAAEKLRCRLELILAERRINDRIGPRSQRSWSSS